MQFTENTDLFPFAQNTRLPSFDKARVVCFRYVIVHLQIVQQTGDKAGGFVKVSVLVHGKKAETLAGSCTGIFFGSKVRDFSRFKDTVRIDRIA